MGKLRFSVAGVERGSRESRMRKMTILWMFCPFCEPMSMDDTIAIEGTLTHILVQLRCKGQGRGHPSMQSNMTEQE